MPGPRILLIDDFIPNGTIGAGVPRMVQFLRALVAANADVTVFPTAMKSIDPSFADHATPFGATIVTETSDLPGYLADCRGTLDALLISRPPNMALIKEIGAAHPSLIEGCALIYDAEALFAERKIRMAEVLGDPLQGGRAASAMESELSLADGADIVLAVSEAIAAKFRERGHPDVRVLGNAVVPQPTPRPFHARRDLLSVGLVLGDASPNADAIVWFMDKVLPILRVSLGEKIALNVAGFVDAPRVQTRAGKGMTLLGRLPDLSGVYNRARIFVAATRYASGLPLKIHEAAAFGVPCVVTPLLAEQLGWRSGKELLAAADPHAFAEACIALYRDEALWTGLRNGALARVAEDCDAGRFDHAVADLVGDIAKVSMA